MKTLTTKNIYAISALSLFLGLMFNYLFFDKEIGVSFFIYVVLLLLGLFGLFGFFKVSYNRAVLWYLLPILFFSFMFVVRDNEFLLFWNFVLTVGLLLLLTHHLIGRSIKNSLFLDYAKTAVVVPLNVAIKGFSALGRMLLVGKGMTKSQKHSQIIKGIVITLPIAVFFLFLFSSADLVFNKFVSSIFSFNLSVEPELVVQTGLVLFFSFIWLSAYIFILENLNENEELPVPPIVRNFKFGNIEAGILFTTLGVLFFSFVIVQIKYLFAGHHAITNLGFTYAEYAHKGFGELVVVSLLTFGLIFLAERYIERAGDQTPKFFKISTGILAVLVLVIMASAFMRLSIYEQAYSFTFLRVLVQAFILWLTAIFLWLVYKIIKGVGDRAFVFGIFLSVVTFFAILNLINPDAFVARKNIEQFAKTGKLDTKYLGTLSTDAVPELMPLLEMKDVKDKYGSPIPQEVSTLLQNYYKRMLGLPWQAFSFSRSQAWRLIDGKWEVISELAK